MDLPAFGKPDERGVGQQLHLEPQPVLLAVLALLGEARAPGGRWTGSGRCPDRRARRGRRRSGRRGCTRSASTSPSRVFTTGALGDGDDEVLAAGAVALAPARGCPISARRCGWSRNASSDATLRSARRTTSPPLPPSPPSGPPLGTWASRRNDIAPAPPSPPAQVDLDLVDELPRLASWRPTLDGDAATGRVASETIRAERRPVGDAGTMSTSLRPLRWPKRTTPSAVANSVSSPPLPTFSPGWNRVPRWRTMIDPARHRRCPT